MITEENVQAVIADSITTSCMSCKRFGPGRQFKKCISYSQLHMSLEELRERIVEHKPVVETDAMKRGTAAHKSLSDGRGVIDVPGKALASIAAGKRTAWTMMTCATDQGLRGMPDTVVSQLSETEDGFLLEHTIIEDKPHGGKLYAAQANAEAEVLSDPMFMVHLDSSTFNGMVEGPAAYFYDVLKQILTIDETGKKLHVNVRVVINYYGDPASPVDGCDWIVRGEPTPTDRKVEIPTLWSSDFKVVPQVMEPVNKPAIVAAARDARISVARAVPSDIDDGQLRFTTKAHKGLDMVDTYDSGMGLYMPKAVRARKDQRLEDLLAQEQQAVGQAQAQPVAR